MHWPGAAVMLVFSLTLFSAVFIPFFFIQRMIENKSGISIVTNIFGLFTTFLMFMGVLFKIMHWPGASIMIVFGTLLFICPTLILYAIQQFKEQDRRFSEFWKMMFLSILASVFVLFWGTSVSRDILTSFINIEDASIVVNQNLVSNNAYLLDEIQKKDTTNIALIEAANNIHKETVKLNEFIESIKNELIDKVELNPDAKRDHWYINAKDNYDVPTRYIGDYDSKRGIELHESIVKYNAFIKESLSKVAVNDTNIVFINLIVRPEMTSGYEMKWNEAMFYSQTMAGTLALLSSLQTQSLNAEFKALTLIIVKPK